MNVTFFVLLSALGFIKDAVVTVNINIEGLPVNTVRVNEPDNYFFNGTGNLNYRDVKEGLYDTAIRRMSMVKLKDTGWVSTLPDSIYIINTVNSKLKLYYTNKFLDPVAIVLPASGVYTLSGKTKLLLYQPNKNQNFYQVYPGDTLFASVDIDQDIVLSTKNDTVRNNELNISRIMNKETPVNFYKMGVFRNTYFDKNYKAMDSIYVKDYYDKTNFIKNYKAQHPISGDYCQEVLNSLKLKLIGYKLWLATNSKAEIDTIYSNALINLKPSIDSLSELNSYIEYPWAQYNYVRLNLKNLFSTDSYSDSLYVACKKEIYPSLREKALFRITKEEIQKNPNSKKWFIEDFIATCEDSSYKNYILDLIDNAKLMASAGSNDVLITGKNNRAKYDSLINALKGKIIYIDFWASWCAPCRHEMKLSAAIRNKYKADDIAFVYISIDDNIKSWQQACTEDALNNYSLSYLLINAQSTQVSKKFKITSIPRYILLDKTGKIINANAPRPSDPELKALLDKYISQ